MKNFLCYLIITLLIVFNSFGQMSFTTEQWLEDLEYVVNQLREHHPNLYYRVSEKDFKHAMLIAKEEIKHSKSDIESFFAIRKVMAHIRDGHTQLFDIPGMTDFRFPFRLEKFSDGVFISVIRRDYHKYLGSRVTAVNGKPVEHVLELNEATIGIDSAFGKSRPSVQMITFAKIMAGLGITENEKYIELELITKEGENEKVTIESVYDNRPILWSNRMNQAPAKGEYVSTATLLGEKTPLHLKKQGDNIEFYWFEHLKKDRAIYFQYNQVANQRGHKETWIEFTERFWLYVDHNDDEIDKLIIDIRYNDGGNGRTMFPFISNIIKRDKFRQGKNLFVLIGNRTYSAAVIFMHELAEYTDAVFVGSPSASPFNFFSDMKTVGQLPNCGAGLGISSRQIDNAWFPQTDYFQPDIPAPFSSLDYFSGKDPVLDVCLHGDIRSVEDVAVEEGAENALKYYKKLKKKYASINWWNSLDQSILEYKLNQTGYRLMEAGDFKQASELFRLNTILFPDSFNVWDSYGEMFMVKGDSKNAIRYYEKSLKLNPENENARQMIKQIKEKNEKK